MVMVSHRTLSVLVPVLSHWEVKRQDRWVVLSTNCKDCRLVRKVHRRSKLVYLEHHKKVF